jgi:hypothetical protein
MKTTTRFRTAAALVALALATIAPLGAQITVDNSTFWSADSGTLTGTLDASASDKLVVIVTGEHGFPNNEGGNCTGVTYDGVALTQAVDRNPVITTADPKLVDQTYNDIWYLDNPASLKWQAQSPSATTKARIGGQKKSRSEMAAPWSSKIPDSAQRGSRITAAKTTL